VITLLNPVSVNVSVRLSAVPEDIPTCAEVKVRLALDGVTVCADPGMVIPTRTSATPNRAKDVDLRPETGLSLS
jgi:hypothetical protein